LRDKDVESTIVQNNAGTCCICASFKYKHILAVKVKIDSSKQLSKRIG